MRTIQPWLALGAVFGLAGVVAGAVGTHALSGSLDDKALRIFDVAVRFQMYHALALLATGLLALHWRSRVLGLAGTLFSVGIVLFSGSLYLLAVTGVGAFGAVAPAGGLSLMGGWASLVVAAVRHRDNLEGD